MKRICTICARGGSKGVKNKNIRELAGKPLISLSLQQASESRLFDLIAVSSDSAGILDVACNSGADLIIERPAELASDTAAKIPAIRHCVEQAENFVEEQFDVVVDLDATSPLRSIEDIKGSVDLLERNHVSNVITAAPSRRSPYFNLIELGENGVARLSKPLKNNIVRRQDSPKCFDMNAAVYVWTRTALFERPTVFNADTLLFVMPEERSIDIDSELDFQIVEFILKNREKK